MEVSELLASGFVRRSYSSQKEALADLDHRLPGGLKALWQETVQCDTSLYADRRMAVFVSLLVKNPAISASCWGAFRRARGWSMPKSFAFRAHLAKVDKTDGPMRKNPGHRTRD